MEPILFPILLGAVALLITLIDKIPIEWRHAIGGAILVALIADSVIAAISAVLQQF